MDYLTRDSFFSGVSEGVIGYDRILKMLTVHDGELMVEEKGIYSIEKFLVARRLMYWQVYLHKTVLCAEQMLKRIIRRARLVGASAPEPLNRVLHEPESALSLDDFSRLDDYDVLTAIKHWATHPDRVLALLSKGIVDRQLLKVRYLSEPATNEQVEAERAYAQQALSITANEAEWLVFTGEASSSTYNFRDEQIQIVFKDGTVRDISEVDHALISQNLMGKVKKYYICFHR
jgi:HD superfamily phosphohydrolase